jgi:hypothetical protein
MEVSSTSSVHKSESPFATGISSKIRVKNDGSFLSVPKTNINSREIGSFSITSMFDANVYSRMLSHETVALDKIPVSIFATQTFISECLKCRPKDLIAYMNSWTPQQMSDFMEKYDVLPEAMLGRLFAEGLNPAFIPRDIKFSPSFLRVAANANPDRLTTEILSKEDIQSVRLAIRNLDDNQVEKLWRNGMSTAKLPTIKSSNDKFVSRIKLVNSRRFEKEIQNPINAMLRSKIEQHSLMERKASTSK